MAVDRKVMIPGGVSVEMDAKVEGAIPHSKTLVVVFPIAPYDLEDSATLGASRGVQWWTPGTPLKIKLDNRTRFPETLPRGTVVAEAFAVNSDDLERMILLKEPLLEHPPEPPPEEQPQIIPRTAPPPPSSSGGEDPGADFT